MENDIIRLRNMRFYAYHGLFPEEARLGQRFEVDVDLIGDFSEAGRDDDLNNPSTMLTYIRSWKRLLLSVVSTWLRH